MQEEIAGVENAGVENAGGITYGKPSEQKTLKIPGVQAKTIRSQTVFAHEQRPGVHIHAVAVRFAASPSQWCCVFTNWTDLQINTIFLVQYSGFAIVDVCAMYFVIK